MRERRPLGMWIDDRLAVRARQYAERTLSTGKLPPRPSLIVARVIVALILATPVLTALAGVYLVSISYPGILGTALGLGFVALGWVLFPRRARMPKETLCREDLPHLFALLDRIADAMNAPRADVVRLDDSYNAYAATFRPFFSRKKRLLGIGLTLWATLDSPQRIAVLAHETGHFVSRDPERGTFLRYGKVTLARWGDWLMVDGVRNPYSRRQLPDLIVSAALAGAVFLLHGIWTALHWTMMFHSQMAEYLADAQSAGIAGQTATLRLMDALILSPETERAVLWIGNQNRPDGGWIFDHVAAELHNAPPERAEAHRRTAEQERASRKSSHPPTVARKAFLNKLPEMAPKVMLDETEAAAIDTELSPHKDRLGALLLRKLKAR
ncbi:MAG: M48 family metalloprotease [Rhodobacteraceae bacterium]|nr:M48 family metalloprotease [Paracoccaceae bacterium]